MSGTQHLIQSIQILERLADVADELIAVQRQFDFERVKELVEENAELRPQLAAVTEQLKHYQPQTDDERELLGFVAPLLKRIKEGDRVFTIWRGNLEMMRFLGSKMASQAIRNLAFLSHVPTWDILKDSFEGVPAVVVSAGPSLDKNFHLLEGIRDRAVIITMNRCAKLFQGAGYAPHLLLATDGSALLPETHLAGVGPDILKNLFCRFSSSQTARRTRWGSWTGCPRRPNRSVAARWHTLASRQHFTSAVTPSS